MEPELVCLMLGSVKVDLTDEKRAQSMLAEAMRFREVPFEAEHRLSPRDRVDFLIAGGVAVEVKLNSARPSLILRQLLRYARHDAVRAIVLATNRAVSLPAEIGGKPAFHVSLGRAWI